MSLQIRISDLITAIGTDIKQLRVWITGSATGNLTTLATTDKTSIIAAVNEVNTKAGAGGAAASETTAGIAQIATNAEALAGTIDTDMVTPLKLQQKLTDWAQPKSANLTNLAGFTTSASATLLENSDTVLATQKATKAYADSLLDANNAYVYKGVIDAALNPNYPAANAGHTYKISVAGRIGGAAGPVVEVGDTVTALVDASAAGDHATVGANWIITQTNIDGAVVGPATSTAANIPTFSGATGKVIQDSGVSVSIDGTMATNNNTKVPTEGAIRTYLGANHHTKTEIGNPETDLVAAYNTAKA